MTALAYSRPTALPRAAAPRRPGVRPLRSPAVASLLTPFLMSGVLSAVAVPALQLSLLGPINNFASMWLENWLVAWAISLPAVYLLSPVLVRLARFVSSPAAESEGQAPGPVRPDIAAAPARASARHGFTVLRNLKVREDFYHA